MVVVEQREKEESGERRVTSGKKRKAPALTTPDLVLLSLLAERPMHGYQANAELERREIRDWAAISRPQVYYSLEKLAKGGLIRASDTGEPAAGPQKTSYATTAKGREALAQALARKDWATQRERPAFLTWLALSWQAAPATVREQLHRREEYLALELAREKETLDSVLQEVGHAYHEAVWMITLMIDKFEVELRWVRRVAQEIRKRDKAKHPDYARG